jgi:hypothetical protein
VLQFHTLRNEAENNVYCYLAPLIQDMNTFKLENPDLTLYVLLITNMPFFCACR